MRLERLRTVRADYIWNDDEIGTTYLDTGANIRYYMQGESTNALLGWHPIVHWRDFFLTFFLKRASNTGTG